MNCLAAPRWEARRLNDLYKNYIRKLRDLTQAAAIPAGAFPWLWYPTRRLVSRRQVKVFPQRPLLSASPNTGASATIAYPTPTDAAPSDSGAGYNPNTPPADVMPPPSNTVPSGNTTTSYGMDSSGNLITTVSTDSVTQTGSGGTSGVLPDVTTATSGLLRVMQVQVVTR